MTKKTKRRGKSRIARLIAAIRRAIQKMRARKREPVPRKSTTRKAPQKTRGKKTRTVQCQGCLKRKPYLCPLGCDMCDGCCPGHDLDPAGEQ